MPTMPRASPTSPVEAPLPTGGASRTSSPRARTSRVPRPPIRRPLATAYASAISLLARRATPCLPAPAIAARPPPAWEPWCIPGTWIASRRPPRPPWSRPSWLATPRTWSAAPMERVAHLAISPTSCRGGADWKCPGCSPQRTARFRIRPRSLARTATPLPARLWLSGIRPSE